MVGPSSRADRRSELWLSELHVTTISHGTYQEAASSRPLHTAMRLKRHAPLLQSTLKRVAHRSLAPSLCIRCRRYASSTAYPENIAVLGGGISGLASAYFASKEFPNSKITLYEAGNETGGWIRSKRVDVPGGNVLFESGPRTLRPGINCLPAAGLVSLHHSHTVYLLTLSRFKI